MNGMSYETVEISGAQMVLTMKLTTFAWNVWDGNRPAEVRSSPLSIVRDLLRRHPQDLDKWQLANRVSKFPSLLEFFGYA